jgi:hypothetical protein
MEVRLKCQRVTVKLRVLCPVPIRHRKRGKWSGFSSKRLILYFETSADVRRGLSRAILSSLVLYVAAPASS